MLSVDVDGWDYQIWQGLRDYRPMLVVIEYNPTFPPHIDFVGAQDDSRFGASALALSKLATRKEYSLVCCTRTNMFFVQSDVVQGLRVTQPTMEQAFRHDNITYVVSTQHGNPVLTRELPFVSTSGLKGVLAQALPPCLPGSTELRTVVIVDLGWLRKIDPLLVPFAKLARAIWRLGRRFKS